MLNAFPVPSQAVPIFLARIYRIPFIAWFWPSVCHVSSSPNDSTSPHSNSASCRWIRIGVWPRVKWLTFWDQVHQNYYSYSMIEFTFFIIKSVGSSKVIHWYSNSWNGVSFFTIKGQLSRSHSMDSSNCQPSQVSAIILNQNFSDSLIFLCCSAMNDS